MLNNACSYIDIFPEFHMLDLIMFHIFRMLTSVLLLFHYIKLDKINNNLTFLYEINQLCGFNSKSSDFVNGRCKKFHTSVVLCVLTLCTGDNYST